MDQQNITPDSTERFVPAQYIMPDNTIVTYHSYMVSDHGRIVSMKGKAMRALKPGRNKYGYLQVIFCINGKTYQRSVHRLVLSSFHPEQYFEGAEVDHKDRCPANNRLDNLHWIDHNGNLANRTKCPVKQIRVTHLSDGRTELFDSMSDCSRAFGKHVLWCSEIISRCKGFNAKYNIIIEKIS